MNLFNNSNWRKENEKLKWAFNLILILNEVDLEKILYDTDRFRSSYSSSFPSISNYENYDERKQEGVCDSII